MSESSKDWLLDAGAALDAAPVPTEGRRVWPYNHDQEESVTQEYRRAILRVRAQVFLDLVKHEGWPRHFTIVENALPDDAVAVGGGAWLYNSLTDTIDIAVESASFEPVALGEELPVLPEVSIRTDK